MALVLLAPVLLAIALAIRLSMGAPVLFRQDRIGRGGAVFTIVKFRSLDDGGRPTALGSVLRRFSLDELPEFWNVINGDMALVGPRPLLPGDQPPAGKLREARQSLLPGVTGWAQVRGRNRLTFERTYRLDSWYSENRSLALDVYILLLTLPVVATGRGACGLATRAQRHLPGSGRRIERTS